MAKVMISDDRSRVRLYPIGNRFISGIANAYDDDFPPELDGVVSNLCERNEFELRSDPATVDHSR